MTLSAKTNNDSCTPIMFDVARDKANNSDEPSASEAANLPLLLKVVGAMATAIILGRAKPKENDIHKTMGIVSQVLMMPSIRS